MILSPNSTPEWCWWMLKEKYGHEHADYICQAQDLTRRQAGKETLYGREETTDF